MALGGRPPGTACRLGGLHETQTVLGRGPRTGEPPRELRDRSGGPGLTVPWNPAGLAFTPWTGQGLAPGLLWGLRAVSTVFTSR